MESSEFTLNSRRHERETTRDGIASDTAFWEKYEKLCLAPEQKRHFETLLLSRIKERRGAIEHMWQVMNNHWEYEDGFYRYYHQSWKVYGVQGTTQKAVELLASLLPERPLNEQFDAIVKEGTGKQFDHAHNKQWDRQTRPILEAFSHAKFMIDMCLRYGTQSVAPETLPSGWAALLYLYNLR